MVSRDRQGTRDRILSAARLLFEKRGYHNVGLEEIGAAAGVSRQSVYLHFGSKARLFTELAEWIEEQEALGDLLAPVWEAPSGTEALRRLLEVHAVFEPRIQRIVDVMARARGTDDAIDALYESRMRGRYDGMRRIVARIKREGGLRDGWDVDTATGLVWAMTASSTFRLLAVEQGWTPSRWAERTHEVLAAAILGSEGGFTSGSSSSGKTANTRKYARSTRTRRA